MIYPYYNLNKTEAYGFILCSIIPLLFQIVHFNLTNIRYIFHAKRGWTGISQYVRIDFK